MTLPVGKVNRELAWHFALRSDGDVEVGILGGDIVVRRTGWLGRMLRESCPRWLQEVLLVAKQGLPIAALQSDSAARDFLPRVPALTPPRTPTVDFDCELHDAGDMLAEER
jgi:hypothetical protein